MNSGSGVANSRGVLFEYDPATNTYTKKKDIGTADAPGDGASGSLVVLNNKLYGVAASGGLGNGPLFEYDPITNVYTTRFTFSTSGTNPWRPLGSLVAFRGKLYGQTMAGGLNGSGAVFSFDPALSGGRRR